VKLIVGLGNPGPRYTLTRHNVGFDVLDLVTERRGLEFESSPADAVMARERGPDARVILAKPLTFMNRSGDAVGMLARYFRIDHSDILVVVDDANLPLGRFRARPEGSAGGHNGLGSVIDVLGTQEVPRLRIGVGRGKACRDLADHVLSRFEHDEKEVAAAMVRTAADAVDVFVELGVAHVMNRFNAGPDALESEQGN
jgi:PTH1 family peptidyl-tRNA hydrolase